MDGSCSIVRHRIISRRMCTVSSINWSRIQRNLDEAAVHQKDSLGRDIVHFFFFYKNEVYKNDRLEMS